MLSVTTKASMADELCAYNGFPIILVDFALFAGISDSRAFSHGRTADPERPNNLLIWK